MFRPILIKSFREFEWWKQQEKLQGMNVIDLFQKRMLYLNIQPCFHSSLWRVFAYTDKNFLLIFHFSDSFTDLDTTLY